MSSELLDLDDPTAIAAADPGDMLGAIATAGAQMLDDDAGDADSRISFGPLKAVVVAGMGGSAAAGDVLAAVIGPDASFPVIVHRGYGLPGWVGPDHLVCAVSCSGTTEETISAAATAQERGIGVITVGAPGSALSKLGGIQIDVEAEGRSPRACLWSLAAPLLRMAHQAGLAEVDASVRAAAAADLDLIAAQCGPERPIADNPAKALALQLAGGLPMIWGFSTVASAAATRFANQIAENAKLPSVVGALSEPHHNQVVAFDGPFGRGPGGVGLRPVVLRDTVEEARLGRRADESTRLAADAGLTALQVQARGTHPLLRLTSLIGMLDFASVYLALALRIDPTPVDPIMSLKARLAGET